MRLVTDVSAELKVKFKTSHSHVSSCLPSAGEKTPVYFYYLAKTVSSNNKTLLTDGFYCS